MPPELPVLSTAHLVASSQEAVRQGRLGLQRGAVEPLFVDEDGSVCAIGAALPVSALQAILWAGRQRWNWLALVRAEAFTYDDLDSVEALAALQLGYDACFRDNGLDPRAAERFCASLLALDPHAPPTFASWPEVFGAEAVA